LDNEKLKRKFIRGNKKAFDTIYNGFSNAMYSICLRYTKNTDEAADILQDAFIKIYENRKKFKPEFELASWIKRIVINTAIDHYNKNKKLILIEDDSYFEIESEDDINTESIEDIKTNLIKVLQNLPEGYRTIFNLYVIDNLTHQEISQFLNISINTSKSQLSRARKMLKIQLKENNTINKTATSA
jgi:RNA polymerase sigma-70 factor (ECF subfamily)